MSYNEAQEMFDENVTLINPTEEPLLYNISNGLAVLTIAIRNDMNDIKNKLQQMEYKLNNIQ